MQGSDSIDVGSDVWVRDPEVAWVDGTVIGIKGEEASIETTNGKKVSAKLSKLYLKDASAPSHGVEDMTRLFYLHEPGILHNLGTRYELNEIYTYTGNILIAINPFQNLSHLYDDKVMEQYKGKPLSELRPHVFAIAEAAYRAMINEQKSNSILVSGESGAGKTETTKMLMRYLAFLGGNCSADGQTIEQKVLESNPVLEAFGNAKTVRNNNSSRFGKFVEIQFDKDGKISGAAIRTYLLEKSRVCQISDPERNYHSFYLLCAAPPEVIEKYKLGSPDTFRYLNQSNCYQLIGVNEAREYLATRKAMDIVGISGQDQDAIFKIVAAILHLGNVDFAKEDDASVLKDDKSKFHLQMTAELLMCDCHALENALLKRVMVTRGERIKKSLDPAGSVISRDGLAKMIYSRLFNWLVDKINGSIGQDVKSTRLIGVLDIYGFESFQSNSFEQFCINFTNEKLQQHFNQHVFKMDQEEKKCSPSLAERRGSLSKSLKLPVISDNVRVVKNSSDFLANQEDCVGVSNDGCSVSEPDSIEIVLGSNVCTKNGEGNSVQDRKLNPSLGRVTSADSSHRDIDFVDCYGESWRSHSMGGGMRSTVSNGEVESGSLHGNLKQPVVCLWPNLERIFPFGRKDLDSAAAFAIFHQTTGLGKNENGVLYFWIGGSFNDDKGRIQLGRKSEVIELQMIDWNHVALEVLTQMHLPRETVIQIIKEDEEPDEFAALLNSL